VAQGVLRDIRARLLVAYATCVTAQQALLAQNCEHDQEIARCLRWGVADVLSAQADVLGTACSVLEDRSPADGSLADGTPSAGTSTRGAVHTDAAARLKTRAGPKSDLRENAVRSTKGRST
jgi:hypothetical protein